MLAERPGGVEQPALAVAAVARRLGVAPATLRTWDRRYGLGPSEHSAGSHRRYSADDVARLLVMRRLTLEGVAPADAAKSALQLDPAAAADAAPLTGPDAQGAPDVPVTPAQLVEAALAEDEEGCRRLLRSSLDVDSWWTRLVEPARASVASRTVLARPGEDPEWVLDSAVLAALRARDALRRPPSGGRHAVVLLLAAPGEQRPVPLHVLAAALAERGVDSRVITGPLEARRVQELALMARPVAVVMLSELATPDLGIVAELHASSPDLPVFVAIADDRAAEGLPVGRSIHRARSFTGLLHEVLAVSS